MMQQSLKALKIGRHASCRVSSEADSLNWAFQSSVSFLLLLFFFFFLPEPKLIGETTFCMSFNYCSLHSNFRKANESTLRCRHCKYHSLVTYFPWSLVKCEFKACSIWKSIKITSTFYIHEAERQKTKNHTTLPQ